MDGAICSRKRGGGLKTLLLGFLFAGFLIGGSWTKVGQRFSLCLNHGCVGGWSLWGGSEGDVRFFMLRGGGLRTLLSGVTGASRAVKRGTAIGV